MTIITENIRATNTKYINVTYDSAILIPSFNILQGHLILEFVDGITVDDNTGMKFFRDDRDTHYHLIQLDGNQFIMDLEPADVGYSKFRFNLSIANTRDLIIDSSEGNFYGLDDDTEPEPEPEPEPEIITVELQDKFNINRNYDILFNGAIWGIDELYDDSTGDYADGYITQNITKGDMVNIEIQSNDGFLFSGYNALYDSHYNMYDFEGSDTFQSVEFEPVESGKIELEISVIPEPEEPEPEEPEEPEPEPEPEFNFNKIYQVKNEVLNYLAQLTPIPDTNHFTDYIINLIEIPFAVPENYLSDVDSIIIGFSEFEKPALKVDRDLLKFNVGEITVPEKYGNSYDYVDTECILHLPYHSNITIDSNYVIDSTIKLEYYLNVYTGDGTVNIYSSKIDDVIHSEKFKLGRVIPFVAKSNMTNEKPDVDFQLFNGIQRAYLEINRNTPVQDLNANRVTVWGRLGDSEGYVEVADVQLNFKSNSMDKTEIKSILGNGVYIK